MAIPRVQKPLGYIRKGPRGSVQLVWKDIFATRWTGNYSAAQEEMAVQVIRYCEPFVPYKTGRLMRSGHVTPSLGVSWNTPYASIQYYSPRPIGSATGALRGPFWFDRMKRLYSNRIIVSAKRKVGRL